MRCSMSECSSPWADLLIVVGGSESLLLLRMGVSPEPGLGRLEFDWRLILAQVGSGSRYLVCQLIAGKTGVVGGPTEGSGGLPGPRGRAVAAIPCLAGRPSVPPVLFEACERRLGVGADSHLSGSRVRSNLQQELQCGV